jgi:hypothetical protein
MTDALNFDRVPQALRGRPQWVLWQLAERGGKPTKIPVRLDGTMAKANDPTTWDEFDTVREAFDPPKHAGVGFVFSADDPFCGIDLDGCRDPQTGLVAEWAREVILKLDSYAELSPSKTGVKVFCRAASPFAGGRKVEPPGLERVCDKTPAIEVYDRLRYFAVTGWQLRGPAEPQDRAEALGWLKDKYWPEEPRHTPAPADFHSTDAVVERARKYLAKLPPAVSGQSGHNATFHAACVLVLGFELSEADATALMLEFNQRCEPPWSERDIARKVREAGKQPGRRGYLRNAAPANWGRIPVPTYTQPAPAPEPRTTTLVEAGRKYIESVRRGEANLIGTSVPDLDYALGGGLEFGEMVIFAARPSHGKSAVALQAVHDWTAAGMPCLIVSEEMSAMMLGKRTLQYITALPQESWEVRTGDLEDELEEYGRGRAPCYVAEGCGTAAAAVAAIEKHVREDGVRCVVVDYAQLLRSEGRSRYEQITNTSIFLRQAASMHKVILLVLCQLNREVEHRGGAFLPVMSDLRDSGQLEQDADVITFLCWPHRLDRQEPESKYQFFIAKNRNRATREHAVVCRFLPDRQRFMDALPEIMNERADAIG